MTSPWLVDGAKPSCDPGQRPAPGDSQLCQELRCVRVPSLNTQAWAAQVVYVLERLLAVLQKVSEQKVSEQPEDGVDNDCATMLVDFTGHRLSMSEFS